VLDNGGGGDFSQKKETAEEHLTPPIMLDEI
jgi:hypothetical protein